MFSSNPNDYELRVELNSNCCNNIATVYLSQYLPTDEHVAVKKYRLDIASNNLYNQIQREVIAMRQLNHPNILSFHIAFSYNMEMYLISPFMCYCSCSDIMKNIFERGLPESVVAHIVKDVLFAMDYLHRNGYIHRAIRASHILLNQNKAVLTGFRESTNVLIHGKRKSRLFELAPNSQKSLIWLAPEVLAQNLEGYNDKSDIYSLGIAICELANGITPFSDMLSTYMLTEKIRGNKPTILDNSTCPTEEILENASSEENGEFSDVFGSRERLLFYSKKEFTDPFHKFSEICLERHPEDRPSVLQLLNHQFIKQWKHTSLFRELQNLGVKVSDYSQIKDDTLALNNHCNEMSLNGSFDLEWD